MGDGGGVWRSPAFLGAFGDPFLRNTPYEFGGNPQALLATLDALAALLAPTPTLLQPSDAVGFALTPTQEAFINDTLLAQLQICRAWTDKGAKVADAKQFQAFLSEWKAFVGALAPHQPTLVPGGFVGNTTSHTMIYVIEKTDADHYSFTVCNKGPGAEMYHATTIEGDAVGTKIAADCDKIRVRPFVQLSNISTHRFLDMAFWSLLFSLWMRKPPSEYHRVETIYDVLLPWLAGDKLLPLAIDETEMTWITSPSLTIPTIQQGRTPQRSNLGYCKSVLEAVRFLCLAKGGFSPREVKYSVLFQLRYRLFQRLVRDLEVARDPAKGVADDALEKALRALAPITLRDSLQGGHSLATIAPGAVVGVYFARAASPGCKQLTKSLIALTEKLRAEQKQFVMIVVSVDHEQDEYVKLTADLPANNWLLVPFEEVETRKALVEAFTPQSIPTLIVRDALGSILTPRGKELIEQDPTGRHFPWNGEGFQLPVQALSYSERLCVEMGVKQIGLKTLRHHKASNLSTPELLSINRQIARVDALLEEIAAAAKAAAAGDQDEEGSSSFKETVNFIAHSNMDLLQADGREDHYAGNAADVTAPVLGSFLDVPERVTSIPLAVGAFTRCRNLCESLLRRAADGSSSSRVSLHHEVIQLITTMFVEVLPVPQPSSASAACMWRQPVTKEMQLKCLNFIYTGLMVLGSVWQSIEQPTRQFDSERSLAAICGLAIFDALLRTPASDEPLEISLMMERDDGYVLAHRFCKANFSVRKATSAMEFARPNFCLTRGQVLAYFDRQDQVSKFQLFDYHMPEEKIELKKYSTTLIFFRRLMETYNYQLIDVNDPNPPTEMEALMEWFCGDDSDMARDHPEVALARDLVMIVKFLATMETKEVELMRRRQGTHQWQQWQLSFDDSASTHRRNFFGMRGLDRILNGSIKWEVVNFRGSDQDIVDIDVIGFMERKIYFGEGPVVVSPTDLGSILVSDSKSASAARGLPPLVTEDDIMHLDYLPTFSGTLSSEESEYLTSYLTVPYARIPLVVSFFASRDRVTYLFNPALQNLFRAALFESGDWVSDDKQEEITHIPLRKSSLLMREEAVERVFDARIQHQKCEDHLGTMNGLLLNELAHASDAVMQPLLKMLHSIRELGEASVHSADARFILYMIKVGMDVLRYATFTVDWYMASSAENQAKATILEGYRQQLIEYASGFAYDTLEKWRIEAESANNLQTACVIHSYMVLLYVGLRPAEYTCDRVARMVGSIAYVRNWHCFGMKVSTAEGGESGGLSAEDRLLRWLQAQGINTENVAKSSLDKYLKGRPLYLKIGMQTIQAPSIIALRSADGEDLKLPPGEVLEVEIFETMQIHRRNVVKWLSSLPHGDLHGVLGEVVRIALRSSEPDSFWQWQEGVGVQNAGRYSCTRTELKLDVQTGEILWRNDELKPVPDSMTQYGDFKSIFGNKSLHCGLVVRQEHRLWIKIVGTDYELIEWDDPEDSVDQGVGAPKVFVPTAAEAPPVEEELKMYWECPACTCANFNGDNPNATCDVCGSPRFPNRPQPARPQPGADGNAPKNVAGFVYIGETFSRVFDIYSEEDHPHVEEAWFVELVGNVMRLLYPPDPEDKKLQFQLFLPKNVLNTNAQRVHLVGLDQGPKDKKDREKMDTFKEIVAYRAQEVVHVYALVSHGRRMYRKLIFTSSSRASHHGFSLNVNPDAGPVDPLLLRAGGEPRERQSVGGSLVVLRKNRLLNGSEQYVPPRMLQGIVPSSLLEAFRFWLGEDGGLRGEPLDSKSQWFRYRVQVDMVPSNGSAVITRRSIKTSFSRITQMGKVASSEGVVVNVVSAPPPAPVGIGGSRGNASHMHTATEVRDEDVVQLMAMGFSYAACGAALRESSSNVAMAAQWLLDETNQAKIAEAEAAAESGDVVMSEDEVHEQNVGLLMSLESSPSRVAVEYALEVFEKDAELARAWLLDPLNADEIKRVDGPSAGSPPIDESLPLPQPMVVDSEEQKTSEDDTLEIVEEAIGETLVLLNLLDARSTGDEDLLRITRLLCRLEDLSHILVWCKPSSEGNPTSIEFVELPRLKIKLSPKRDSAQSTVRFEVMDQNGWFISDAKSAAASSPQRTNTIYLEALLSTATDAWLLESDTNDLKLVCPNHDLYRPQVHGEPLGNLVIGDRASMGWQQAMETRFYSYPIHSSRTFLLPPSLSSTLYLILANLLSRDYATAMEFITGVTVDVKFTDEEKWIFDQLIKTLDDRHPNACASRVRLSLSIAYSENKAPWKLAAEVHDYLSALEHVDAVCKLTLEEEQEALKLCHQRSPLLLLRKEFCNHTVEPSDANGAKKEIDFKLTRSRVGGQPWMKLRLFSKDYLTEHGKKLSTVRYNRPKHAVGGDQVFVIDDEEAGKLVWNCAVVGDEISGSNRGLGFMFLYECLNRQVRVSLGGEDCTHSYGDLAVRFLHLKLSRWGRETVEEGEEESVPSLAIAQLALMAAHPYDQWSLTPTDGESTRMLSFGANLYSKMTFGSLVKSFFEIGEVEFLSKLSSEDHQKRIVRPLKTQFSRAHLSAEHSVVILLPSSQRGNAFEASNTSCETRVFASEAASSTAINPEFPLECMDFSRYITFCDPESTLALALPFDLSQHPAAQTAAAKDLLKRLGDDITANAIAVNESKDAFITNVTPRDVVALGSGGDPSEAVKSVEMLIESCSKQRAADRSKVDPWILQVEAEANKTPAESEDGTSIGRFLVERRIGAFPRVKFDYLTSLLSSSAFEADLTRRNPFAARVCATDALVQRILSILLLCNRIVHINRTIQLARVMIRRLRELEKASKGLDASGKQAHIKQTLQASKDLADALLSKRHYLERASDKEPCRFDPRFLVFEYVFDILLRGRQVQMIDSFLQSLARGDSRVQQMIMGAGKTTVVGPLLTYILADKQHLVTHVMPTALLEQSRQVLRSRFSNAVLRKRIFTFEFDRSVSDDPQHALKLFEKVNRARRHGDVVCASPESIKSMMLKVIELLHSLEESSEVIQLPPSKALASQNIRRIRRTLEDRSEMADELHKVMKLWQEGGILIMDEVDVLLHPLRSELNFPIGNKFPIDLAANRWELPIQLIDAVLHHSSDGGRDVNKRLHEVLAQGYASHALQRFPHLVLLDMEFYEARMMPIMTEIAISWLLKHLKMGKMEVTIEIIAQYLQCDRQELHTNQELRDAIDHGLSDSSIKLVNLARDWIRTILPHVLSKINRVSYGLLRGEYHAQAASGASGGNSHSRLMLAVPFVGKDVPSRSSEFAHPDVLIGLTILAYRYEGIRVSDLVRIVSQLKQDFSRQLGPRDQRPACAMFRDWVTTGLSQAKNGKSGGGVLPLPLFQLRDPSQVSRLHALVAKLAGVVYYYARQHVFPSCMNFQKLKISACGHELGSNALFSKRIGFSGTPSNLLPMDLGECHYEPRSDGSIFQALTSARIVSVERKVSWSARSLLLDIAQANPPFHTLIDTGALITGFENHEVAAFLLQHLPPAMEGVVYLDNEDRQMILLRDHNAPMPLVQCGLSPAKRFTFYDQVHTTGMDIKQAVDARAVVTLGKDMTFRDYAQGAYRMRGIETGQSIHLFMIPEVENRIRHEMALAGMADLAEKTKQLESFLLLVPAWLLINSMRMESMQLVQLSLQELHNTWRKRALRSLMSDIARAHDETDTYQTAKRLRRFIGDGAEFAWLRKCIDRFREEISYTVESVVPTKKELRDVIDALVLKHQSFVQTDGEKQRIDAVKERLAHSSKHGVGQDDADHADMRLTAEVVHENEQEAEEEAEEEAEQEEQKMSAFTRDDEHPIPWSTSILAAAPSSADDDDSAVFYPFSKFQAHTECPAIAFPGELLVSGNFFRRRWVGLGERRVKNVGLILEWSPLAEQEMMKKAVHHLFMKVMAEAGAQPVAPNDAAVKALGLASQLATQHPRDISSALKQEVGALMDEMPVYLATISLAEGETVRRMIHKNHPVLRTSQVRLRTCEGELVESSSFTATWGDDDDGSLVSVKKRKLTTGVQCLRFFNNEMYYTPLELELLLDGVSNVPIALRHEFFECLLRLRRRERHLWGDTPLAKVFTRKDEWHLLSARARMQQFQQSLQRKKKKLQLATALRRFDENGDGRLNAEETLKCFESFQLGYSSGELNEIIGLIAEPAQFEVSGGVLAAMICAAFGISQQQMDEELRREEFKLRANQAHLNGVAWNCPVCTYVNDGTAPVCGACSEPNPLLQDEASKAASSSQQGWQCANCTFINLPGDVACAICELGVDGQRAVPRGKWVCAGEQGGCTFFNAMSNFYCEVCNRARPDLASTKF